MRGEGTPRGKEVAWHVCLRARGFVCLPAGQIYLGGRLSEVLPVEISYKQGSTVMLLSRSRLQPNEKLISFICQRWRSRLACAAAVVVHESLFTFVWTYQSSFILP